jgi:hypothetical protein
MGNAAVILDRQQNDFFRKIQHVAPPQATFRAMIR